MMQTFVRPSRDLRNHYAELSEMLKDHNHVIITNHGRDDHHESWPWRIRTHQH